MSIHIIAEGCTNHDGGEDKAQKLIAAAHETGADSIKFQLIYPEKLYIPKIQENGELIDNPVIAARKKSQLSDDAYVRLSQFAQKTGIPLTASVFDSRGLELLSSFNPPYIKLASCDLNNLPLLAEAAKLAKILVISSGMAELWEIEQALDTVAKNGSAKVVLLHCVSVYPAPLESTNLAVIPMLKERFGVTVGFSDHTLGSTAASAALALGATWFEKHFTLNTSDAGFDHQHSTAPEDFKQYVCTLRGINQALAVKDIKLNEAECQLRPRARRGVYAAKQLPEGHIITPGDLLIVRPEAEFKPDQLDLLVGKKLTQSLKQFEPLQKKVL